MNAWRNHRFIYLIILAYAMLWIALHPSLGYLLDSDAVAYLTIAHRVADGQWLKSVNGLWSPLNSWMIVPFIKLGFDSWATAKVLNFFFGGVLLIQLNALFQALNLRTGVRNYFLAVLVVVSCYFSYFQIFGDVLQLIFALAYVQLFLRKDFVINTKWVFISSILMGFGFYAKSYSLVFYLMHFTVLCLIYWFRNKQYRRRVVLNYSLGVIISVLIVLPWTFQLQNKYGEFALTGLAGKLNMSWYINSGKTFKEDIKLLIPPSFEDSPSFWEDPYLSQGELSTPFSSGHHFKRWVLRVGHTCLMAIKSTMEISIFFIVVIILYLRKWYRSKTLSEPLEKLLLTILILPLGYLAMHIETRYIWLSTFLVMLLGIFWIKDLKWSTKKLRAGLIVFALSFLLFPLFSLVKLQYKNSNLFYLAEEFKKNKISGKIVTNIDDEGSFWVVSYLAELNNYTIERSEYKLDELVQEMNRYGVSLYFHQRDRSVEYDDNEKRFANQFKLLYESDVVKEGDESIYRLYKLKD